MPETPSGPISWSFIQEYIDSKISELQLQIDNAAITMPIGHIFPVITNIPIGCIECDGSLYNRADYPKLFDWLTEQNIMVSDSSWSNTANSNNDYCTKFSTGKGSTTFRVPKFAPFIEIRTESEREDYNRAGLPNITSNVFMGSCEIQNANGCFTVTNGWACSGGDWHDSAQGTLYIDTFRSSSIYGSSSTVHPESNVWLMAVQAA